MPTKEEIQIEKFLNLYKSWLTQVDPFWHKPTEVIPGLLYLGNWKTQHLIKTFLPNCKAVINISKEVPNFHKDIEYLNCPIYDINTENIKEYFNKIREFIYDHISKGQPVLVHCIAGMSRSPTIICNYLCNCYEWTSQQSIDFIKQKRNIVSIIPKFVEELKSIYK